MNYEDYYFFYGETRITADNEDEFLKDEFIFKEIEKSDNRQSQDIYKTLKNDFYISCEFENEGRTNLDKKKKILNLLLDKMTDFNNLKEKDLSMLLNDVLNIIPSKFDSKKGLFLKSYYNPFDIISLDNFLNIYFLDKKKRNFFIHSLIDNIVEDEILKKTNTKKIKDLNDFIDRLNKDNISFFKEVEKRYPLHYKNKLAYFFNIQMNMYSESGMDFETEVKKLLKKVTDYLINKNESIDDIIGKISNDDCAFLNKIVIEFMIENSPTRAVKIHEKMTNYHIKKYNKNKDYKIPHEKLNEIEKNILLDKKNIVPENKINIKKRI